MIGIEKIACPYCADQVRVELNLSKGVTQDVITPCGTCWSPIAINVKVREDDTVSITAQPR